MKKLLIGMALVWAACSGSSLSVDLSNTTVELDVFSGRPNPRWQLTPDETAQLEDKLTGLPQTAPVEIPGHLGYRGFTVYDQRDNARNVITITSNGYVVLHRSSGDTFYRDTKGVRVWLERQAQDRGHGNLVTRD